MKLNQLVKVNESLFSAIVLYFHLTGSYWESKSSQLVTRLTADEVYQILLSNTRVCVIKGVCCAHMFCYSQTQKIRYPRYAASITCAVWKRRLGHGPVSSITMKGVPVDIVSWNAWFLVRVWYRSNRVTSLQNASYFSW